MNSYERQIHSALTKHLPFYRNLGTLLQKDFRKRTFFFIRYMEFRGGDNYQISMEQIAAVSGAYIQISFGVENYLLNDFEVITIYPEAYKSTITGLLHKGDVNPGGAIAISWKDFVKGYETDLDNLNVGLHEMAHAWFFSISHTRFDSEENLYDFLSKFIFLSEEEIVKIRNHRKSIFRKYASENVYEFFAVAIEYFFEDAKEFKEELPKLYRHMCLLLNQDPAEGIYRGIRVEEYFNAKNLYKELSPEKSAQFPDEKLSVSTSLKVGKEYIFLVIIWIFFLISGVMAGIESLVYYAIIFIVPLVTLVFFILKNGREKVSVAQDFLVFRGRNIFRKYLIAIHFDNVLTVNISRYDSVLTLKYLDKGKMYTKILTAASEYDFIRFTKIMGQHNVVLKNEGTRVPRIKSRNRWRK